MSSPTPLLSFPPHVDNNHRKRAREGEDDDDDVEIVSVKRPKTAASGFLGFFRNSISAMADWVRQRGTAFRSNFYVHPAVEGAGNGNGEAAAAAEVPDPSAEFAVQNGQSSSSSSTAGPSQMNLRRPSLRPQWQGRGVAQKRDSLFRSQPGPGVLNGNHEHGSYLQRPGLRGSRNGNLTVRSCIRLEEKERYRQLLQRFAPSATLGSVPPQAPQPVFVNNRQHGHSQKEETLLGTEVPQNLRLPGAGASWSKSGDSAAVAPPVPNRCSSRLAARDADVPLRNFHRHRKWIQKPEERRKSPAEEDSSIVLVSASIPNRAGPQSSSLPPTEMGATAETTEAPSKASEWKQRLAPYLGDRFNELKSSFEEEDDGRKKQIATVEMELKFCEERRKENEKLLVRQLQHTLRICAREPPVLEESEEEESEEESEEEEGEAALPALTEEMLNVVNRAFQPGLGDEVLVEGFRLQLKRSDIHTLHGLSWLNDEVINFYMNLLMERGEGEGRARVYAFNTFFYPKVMREGHGGVRRWTRRVDLFAMDYILVPVHLGMHWCLAIINMREKTIRYYDSMGGNNKACLRVLEEYLKEESLDKKKTPFDLTGWSAECVGDIPQQMNGSDCGMFACKFAEYVTRGAAITFSQQDMPYFRKRMVYEILSKKLLQ